MFKVIHPNRWFIVSLVVISCAFVFIGWQIYLSSIKQDQSQIQEKKGEDLTSLWKSFTSIRHGFEFKYPEDLTFSDVDSGPLGDISSNFDSNGDNYINFRVWDVVEGRNQMSALTDKAKNLFAPEEVEFQNGKFIMSDSYGTGGYYFVNAYYDGGDYVYHFMMSRPDYSPELLSTFLQILATVKAKS